MYFYVIKLNNEQEKAGEIVHTSKAYKSHRVAAAQAMAWRGKCDRDFAKILDYSVEKI